jgi:hypothetical protein
MDIPPARKCWILSFAPWGVEGSSLLLDWHELESATNLQYRVVESSLGIQPNPYSCCRVPLEMTESNFKDLEEFIRQVRESDFR